MISLGLKVADRPGDRLREDIGAVEAPGEAADLARAIAGAASGRRLLGRPR